MTWECWPRQENLGDGENAGHDKRIQDMTQE
jgi:hypothetical protein